MVTLDLADVLEFSTGEGLEVLDEIQWLQPDATDRGGAAVGPDAAGDESGRNGTLLPSDGRPNLVELALQGRWPVGPASGCARRFLPGAGLGGGSADAAAVLRWGGCTDAAVAVGLGADVPFCLAGGRAVVGGVGEIVEPLSLREDGRAARHPALGRVDSGCVHGLGFPRRARAGAHENDLEPAALAVEPRLAWWRRLVERHGRPSPPARRQRRHVVAGRRARRTGRAFSSDVRSRHRRGESQPSCSWRARYPASTGEAGETSGYFPAARRCQRVRFSIFLCFFLRMRLRRFLIREPMASPRIAGPRGSFVRETTHRPDARPSAAPQRPPMPPSRAR